MSPAVSVPDDVGDVYSGVRCIAIESEESSVLVTVQPDEQDFDLCVWELDEDWADKDLYADCHRWRNDPPVELHCRSSRGGMEVDQVQIDDDGEGLMACVVGYQGADGTYRFSAQ